MNSGFLIGMIGVFIIWLFNGFKGKFSEIESKYHNYNHIVGFIFFSIISLFNFSELTY